MVNNIPMVGVIFQRYHGDTHTHEFPLLLHLV